MLPAASYGEWRLATKPPPRLQPAATCRDESSRQAVLANLEKAAQTSMQVPVIDHSPVRRTRRLPVREREGDRTVMAADGPPALGRRNVESRALLPLELVPPPVEECAVCRSRRQEDATVAQYVHRFTFYPAAGQAGALGTVLRLSLIHI